MAKLIVISEHEFDNLFQQTLDKLKLEQFSAGGQVSKSHEQVMLTSDMHRKFHYEICRLKEALKSS